MTHNYDYHKREQSSSWLISHIETLLREGKEHHNSSLILYAALESRNLIEKISYDLIILSSDKSEWSDILLAAKGKQGIRRSNANYKSLKYRFQTFSEAIGRVADLPIKSFDYKQAENHENELGGYIHTYTLTQEDVNFEGEFIQNGILVIDNALNFVKNYFVVIDSNYVFGILNFSSLTGEYKVEFENWKKSVDTDTESLYNRLLEINKRDPLTIKKR